MEIWNPDTGHVKTLFEELPQEADKVYGLKGSKVVPVKGGTEVLFYGGSAQGVHAAIWKYSLASSEWTYIRNMTQARFVPKTKGHCLNL